MHRRIALAVASAYAATLLFAVNYPMYTASGLLVEGVQGRYLFPVLPALLAATVVAVRNALPERARLPVGIATGLAFVLGDYPWFLIHAEDVWFAAG